MLECSSARALMQMPKAISAQALERSSTQKKERFVYQGFRGKNIDAQLNRHLIVFKRPLSADEASETPKLPKSFIHMAPNTKRQTYPSLYQILVLDVGWRRYLHLCPKSTQLKTKIAFTLATGTSNSSYLQSRLEATGTRSRVNWNSRSR